jgi:hypothetical protein
MLEVQSHQRYPCTHAMARRLGAAAAAQERLAPNQRRPRGSEDGSGIRRHLYLSAILTGRSAPPDVRWWRSGVPRYCAVQPLPCLPGAVESGIRVQLAGHA